ncbi:MAG: DUF4389 domain-containing protein [Mycobacterium sp.]|uniref:DUF4389 domain-containing protein n=1 Tax=Mycobacterium sp. TaxID=1785 RepID=UPI0026171FAC|nr:DUF4389 domain-containing protein [Mycobacterium sp.]MDI3315752.1 DUF4389 domain-containing protein [Mycobacterium sp.]
MRPQSYPVRVRGDLDPQLSRWQWLIKWILAVPHYVILIFLHLGVLVVTIVAFFAILITGKYPRPLFDFRLGVLRWRWRVSFYALSALGTDKYPPFSLRTKADYPADLEVDYPERLNRGLVLIKWWLLAVPHYLILLVFFTAGWHVLTVNPNEFVAYLLPPLVEILLVIAMVGLLFTGRYPKGLFEFVLGINRWAIRVVAYATLMRDEYPPFRLDLGPRESMSVATPASS